MTLLQKRQFTAMQQMFPLATALVWLLSKELSRDIAASLATVKPSTLHIQEEVSQAQLGEWMNNAVRAERGRERRLRRGLKRRGR